MENLLIKITARTYWFTFKPIQKTYVQFTDEFQIMKHLIRIVLNKVEEKLLQ